MTAADTTNWPLRRRTVLAAAIAVIGLAGAAGVYAHPDPVNLTVVDRETGQELPIWRHQGRLFVAGEPGARYGLRVTNHTDGRVLVVMSVDGVNILTGETASYNQDGYVLDAYESYDATGWRKSNTEVAAFAFAPLPQSYAARTGRPGDVGIIGVAVFKERVAVQAPQAVSPAIRRERPYESSRGPSGATYGDTSRLAIPAPSSGFRASPAPAVAPPPPASAIAADRSQSTSNLPAPRYEEKLGTAHGAREWSEVNDTTFERATSYPLCIRQIEYDTHANLVASGVIPPSPYAESRPRPFPVDPNGARFVPDPPDEP